MVKAKSNKIHLEVSRKVSDARRKASNARSSVAAFDESDKNKFMLLPDEMKLHIFKNLSPQDLGAVSATCSDFHRLSKDHSLWTELTVDISESRRTLIWKVSNYPWLSTLKVLKINNKNGTKKLSIKGAFGPSKVLSESFHS